MKVLVVGFGWAGFEVALTCRSLSRDLEIIVVSEEPCPAYCRCGLTYAISGEVEFNNLFLRSQDFYKSAGINVLLGYRVVEASSGVARVRPTSSVGSESSMQYDRLVLATGAKPVDPPFEYSGIEGVFKLRDLRDAQAIRRWALRSKSAAIYGSGFLGLQVADALHKLGLKVKLVEPLSSVMPTILDQDVASRIKSIIEGFGVEVYTDAHVREAEGDKQVKRLVGDGFEVDCDMVVLATKVKPRVELAEKLGVKLGVTGGIVVDEHMETSVEGVYAAGDCVEVKELVTESPVLAQIASAAIREARVAASNIAGKVDSYPGTTLTALSKVFGVEIGIAGLNSSLSSKLGLDVVPVTVEGPVKGGYYPGKALVKLLADRGTGRVVGVQCLGEGAHLRASLVSQAIAKGFTVKDLAKLELGYHPLLMPVWDPLIEASKKLLEEVKP